jgi:hypothetical protein
MRLNGDEWLKLTPIIENGVELLDMRIWKKTPTGGVPTRKSLIIPERMIIPLIMTLQKVHEHRSREKASATSAA